MYKYSCLYEAASNKLIPVLCRLNKIFEKLVGYTVHSFLSNSSILVVAAVVKFVNESSNPNHISIEVVLDIQRVFHSVDHPIL